jgi:hypothetical protein
MLLALAALRVPAVALAAVVAAVGITRLASSSRKQRREPQTDREFADLYDAHLASDPHVYPCRLSTSVLVGICGYDPTTSAALAAFSSIKKQTFCLFAARAHLWGFPLRLPEETLQAQLTRSLPAFTLFASCQRAIDGMVLWLDSTDCSSLEGFAQLVRAALIFLSSRDPSNYDCMSKSWVGKRGWRFSFAGEDLFVTTFAPCYDRSSSRFAFGAAGGFILFQAYHSFVTHCVGSDMAHTNWDNPTSVRDRIRCRFKQHGAEYTIPADVNRPIAWQIVQPLRNSDPVVEWWKRE